VTLLDPTGSPVPEHLPALDLPLAPPSEASVRARRLTAAGIVGACTAAVTYVYFVNPNMTGSVYPQCLFKAATGLDCPGCGGTRAMYALLHGDLAGAADNYALIFVVVPVLLYFVVRYALTQFGVTLPAPRARPWMGWAVAGLFVGFTVLRNLPFAPLHYLQSGIA
jgi:hypothetical protein